MIAPEFVIAAPPDWNTTVGFALIASPAVKLRITSWPTLAWVVGPGELLDAILTLESVGAVLSNVTLVPLVTAVTFVPEFPGRSSKEIVNVTLPFVSLEFAVYFAVQVVPLPATTSAVLILLLPDLYGGWDNF